MKDEIDKIEKFLRGKMNLQEEASFIKDIKSNKRMGLQSYIIARIIRSIRLKG